MKDKLIVIIMIYGLALLMLLAIFADADRTKKKIMAAPPKYAHLVSGEVIELKKGYDLLGVNGESISRNSVKFTAEYK